MYEKIKKLCKEKGTNISRLERELGFAKGSICKWKKHIASFDRVEKVASYFGVSVDYFREDTEAAG